MGAAAATAASSVLSPKAFPVGTTLPPPIAPRLRTQHRLLSWHLARHRAEGVPITSRAVLPRWQDPKAPARPRPRDVRRRRDSYGVQRGLGQEPARDRTRRPRKRRGCGCVMRSGSASRAAWSGSCCLRPEGQWGAENLVDRRWDAAFHSFPNLRPRRGARSPLTGFPLSFWTSSLSLSVRAGNWGWGRNAWCHFRAIPAVSGGRSHLASWQPILFSTF